MKKQLIFFLFSLVLVASLQNCKYAKIDSVANTSSEVGFTTINAKGRIIDYKDGTPTAHGHCYSPTIEIPEIGLAGTKSTETPYVDVDFESKIDCLFFDKEYFVRPYMRNGSKIVYGEVQKISTKTPSIIIKNFVVKRGTTTLALDSIYFATDIILNEPLEVLSLPVGQKAREYGFVFCKAVDTTKLIDANNKLSFPTPTSIFDMRFSSIDVVTTNRREINNISVNVNNPFNSNRALFFGDTTNNYYTRGYIKLNRGDVVKYYYSDLIKLPNQTTSLLKFKIK